MPRPTLAEHRTQVRAHLAAVSSATIYEDAEIDQCIRTALGILGLHHPITRDITKSLTAGQTTIDLSTDCPAESVTELQTPTGQIITEFRARHTEIVLRTPITTTGTHNIYYRTAPTITGTDIEWYDPRYRPAVVIHAAGAMMLARAVEIAENDSYRASQMAYAANLMMDQALKLFQQ
jgi:hypothetical protein